MSDINLNEDNNVAKSEDPKQKDFSTVAPAAPTPSKFSKGLIEQIELIVIAFAVIIVLFSFFLRTCEVSGTSMDTTLRDGDNVLIASLFYEPDRGDIIVFHNTNPDPTKENLNEPMVKRVIGLPGDTVKIEYFDSLDKDVMKVTLIYPDGTSEVLVEDYIQYSYEQKDTNKTFYVEEGTIFVMGDNRTVSLDSRNPDVDLVDSRRVLGKVILRITPFSEFGKVE